MTLLISLMWSSKWHPGPWWLESDHLRNGCNSIGQ
jgi:hypothetical protein